MEDQFLFHIEPIGKIDVNGIKLILNHTEVSNEYNDSEETTSRDEDSDSYKSNSLTRNEGPKLKPKPKYSRDDDNDDDDDDEDMEDEDGDEDSDSEYSDIKNESIISPISTPTLTSPSSTSSGEVDNWLSKMSADITSDGQIMVMGGGGNGAIGTGLALVLQKRANSNEWRTTITLDHQTQNGTDRITSIQFIPIDLPQLSYVIGIGYASGYLRVFSIQGNLLLSQLFYNKPVLKIKVSNSPTLPIGEINHIQKYNVNELTLIYPDNVIVNISGITFLSVVQVCFNQIQRGGGGANSGNNNLSYKKWTMASSVDTVNDVTFCGPFLGSPFRALPYSTSEQSMVRLVAVGSNPMVSYYYPTEDGGSTFSVMISSVASRLTTAMFSYAKNWWGGGSSQQQQQQQQEKQQQEQERQQQLKLQQERPVPLLQRWAISDYKREIQTILRDPSGRYAVCTDNIGRVLLLDLVNSLIVKLWKGYRDCQCGFINVTEENQTDQEIDIKNNNNNNNNNKNTSANESEDLEDFIPRKLLKKSTNAIQSRTFLVIYLGRRGILEIWGLKHRSREYFKTIGQGCKLVSTLIPSQFQNINTNNIRKSGTNINLQSYSISEGQSHCFILYPDGSIKEIRYKN
ncbi:hypothetical protein DICPUDRAFT_44031 [Dictyostelium purpureum]|uniref:Rab3-GAP regulatory subunit N-terminal domain-containing protein n=1 Tax=Dictyostelium purpureum TaxID=5786 RepID=F1A597_DICPU|nr:uncharacterized protein DICPUDRAFT_44031 [Dictyostelium purpureum]EGC28634.1 hypothetical protein DICPUDRAFT_44031 [Dictyostelium purpureum]|eukprot:XP_003294839.1 hypothetical protein DICPUDRAFT_44031 [Dictyostelium purpureum]